MGKLIDMLCEWTGIKSVKEDMKTIRDEGERLKKLNDQLPPLDRSYSPIPNELRNNKNA